MVAFASPHGLSAVFLAVRVFFIGKIEFFRARKKRGVTPIGRREPSVESHTTAQAQIHCRIKSRKTLVKCVSAGLGYLLRDEALSSKGYLLRDRVVGTEKLFQAYVFLFMSMN